MMLSTLHRTPFLATAVIALIASFAASLAYGDETCN